MKKAENPGSLHPLLAIHCHLIFLELQKRMDITYGIMGYHMCPNSLENVTILEASN
jgi:hypothetical protein